VRVAEVAARFALDALPGKQLGVDTALQGGAMDPAAARERLRAVEAEAGFFGAMDGAARFVRAESLALTATGIVVIGVAGGVHASAGGGWAAPVAFAAVVFALLLAAAAETAAQAVLAVTAEAVGGGWQRRAAGDRRLLVVMWAVLGLTVMASGLASRLPIGWLVAVAVALVVAAHAVARRQADAPGRGTWAVGIAPSLGAERLAQARAAVEVLRADLAERLGFDPGPADVVQIEGYDGAPAAVVMARGAPVAAVRDLAEEGGEDAPGQAGGGFGWGEALRRALLPALVASAETLMTADAALGWVGEARQAVPPDMGADLAPAAVMADLRGLLRAGLPVPPAGLAAEAMAGSVGAGGRRAVLRRLAVQELFARGGQAVLARQLQPDGRRLLGDVEAGEPMGEDLDALRRSVLEAAAGRPERRWPMVLVEGRWLEQLATLLAGGQAEVVVVGPEELPATLSPAAIEVLEHGSGGSP
jgi:hypothetical protein